MLGKRKPSSYGSAPFKRRKKEAPEEITFDIAAREEYLTGFHKRKLQRIKNAKEEAAKKEREERIRARKMLREERRAELEGHVDAVNRVIREQAGILEDSEESEGWDGISDTQPAPEPLDHMDEYEDEERYTTVTIEEVEVTKRGLKKAREDSDSGESTLNEQNVKAADQKGAGVEGSPEKKKKWWASKEGGPKKKKKFRYESKAERKAGRFKEKKRNSEQAAARKKR